MNRLPLVCIALIIFISICNAQDYGGLNGQLTGLVVKKGDASIALKAESFTATPKGQWSPGNLYENPTTLIGKELSFSLSSNPYWKEKVSKQLEDAVVGQRVTVTLEAAKITDTARVITIVFATEAVKQAAPAERLAFETANPDAAKDYRVFVDGTEIRVHDFFPVTDHRQYGVPLMTMPLAVFPMDKEVQVVVESTVHDGDLIIRPLRAGIKAARTGNRYSFTIANVQQLCLEFGDAIRRPLLLLPHAPEQPPASEAKIRTFKAGEVHHVGWIEMDDNETLHIPAGAVVFGNLLAQGKKNIQVTGHGILVIDNEFQKVGNALRFFDCDGVTLSGITIVNILDAWTVHMAKSRNITITGANVLSTRRDGIDINGCEGVAVEKAFVIACDDAVVVKSTSYSGVNGASARDITVRDSVVYNWGYGNALEIGFELQARLIENLRFQNIDILRATRAEKTAPTPVSLKNLTNKPGSDNNAAISISMSDHATVSNVLFENIRIEECRDDYLIRFRIVNSPYQFGTAERGRIRAVTLRNVALLGGAFIPPSVLWGFDEEHDIDGIRFENFQVLGQKQSSFRDHEWVTNAFVKNVVFQ